MKFGTPSHNQKPRYTSTEGKDMTVRLVCVEQPSWVVVRPGKVINETEERKTFFNEI